MSHLPHSCVELIILLFCPCVELIFGSIDILIIVEFLLSLICPVLVAYLLEVVMLWAACCTGCFGFLHSGEFTCPSFSASNEDMLSVEDVYVDSHSDPLVVTAHLRRSKTNNFGVGAMVYLGRVDGPICPVKALLGYLAIVGSILAHCSFFKMAPLLHVVTWLRQ